MNEQILNESKTLSITELHDRMEYESKNLHAYPIPLPGDPLAGIALPGDLIEEEVKRILEYVDCLPNVPVDAEQGLEKEELPIYNKLSGWMGIFLYGETFPDTDAPEEEWRIPFKVITITLRIGRYAYIRLAEKLSKEDIEQLKNSIRERIAKIEPLPNDYDMYSGLGNSHTPTKPQSKNE